MSDKKVLDVSAAVQDTRYMTTILLEGYHYTKATASGRKTSYRCSHYRSAGCNGKVDLITRTNQFTNFTQHNCQQKNEAEVGRTTSSAETTGIPYTTQGQDQVPSPPSTSVIRVESNHIDPMLLGRIENPPLSLVRNSSLSFFQFNCMSGYGTNNTPNRIIGWAHPHLVELLKHAGSTICVDNLLRRLPCGFKLSIALIVYDKPSSFFVPVFYILCTIRTLSAYRNALSYIVQSTKNKLKPDEIVCNFDSDLLRALQARFPKATVRGSIYLMKQACRIRMEQLEISDEAINIAMEKGVLDMLAIIPSDRVANAGISWVKQQIKTKCAGSSVPYTQGQWRLFWLYFRSTWLNQFPPEVWNLHGLSNSIIARTNNPLEQFCREMDAAFTLPDPNLEYYVTVVETMARHYVAHLAAQTVTLPKPIEVFSEDEVLSDETSSDTESIGIDDEIVNCKPIDAFRGVTNDVIHCDEGETREGFH